MNKDEMAAALAQKVTYNQPDFVVQYNREESLAPKDWITLGSAFNFRDAVNLFRQAVKKNPLNRRMIYRGKPINFSPYRRDQDTYIEDRDKYSGFFAKKFLRPPDWVTITEFEHNDRWPLGGILFLVTPENNEYIKRQMEKTAQLQNKYVHLLESDKLTWREYSAITQGRAPELFPVKET